MSSVFITGCSTGVGEAGALRLAAAGHRIFATVRRETDRARLAEASKDGNITALIMDVTDAASVTAAVDQAQAAGPIDVVVNNAGVPCMGSMEELTEAELQAAFEVNVYGVFRVYQAAVPAMRARGRGQIINISSSIGAAALPMYGGYCATKFAVEAMSEAMRYELAPHGVVVSVLRPGLIATPFGAKKAAQQETRVPAGSPYAGTVDKPSPPGLGALISTPDEVSDILLRIIENPGAAFRWTCGEDARGWIDARRRMNDETFYREAVVKGYGSV